MWRYESLLVLVAVVIGCAVLYLLSQRGRTKKPATPTSLRRELDRLTHDPRVSASLLERERERSPDLSETEVVHVILRRLRRERRR